MEEINLTDQFCEVFLKELKKDIEQNKINLDNISNHITECNTCRNSILIYVKKYLNAGNFLQLLTKFR